jgi:hypothetical protein
MRRGSSSRSLHAYVLHQTHLPIRLDSITYRVHELGSSCHFAHPIMHQARMQTYAGLFVLSPAAA